jgi:predicted ester cyclase
MSNPQTQQNLAAIERAVGAFNNPPERERYFELYANDVKLHGFPADLPAGVAGVKAFFQGFWSAFPDARLRGDDIVVGDGDRIAIRYTIEATHQGNFAGVAPTGRKVTVEGQTILKFAGNKCVERWNSVDMLGLLKQLGALPS